ncbi:MAG TPA: ABC transporter permease, partial [Pseudomonadales bacterium]|nr:ABC transporter permease [Pseudomonadales bacterium]
YFEEYRTWGHGLIGLVLVGLDANARAADVSAAIDARFANSADETSTSSERDYALGFAEQLGDVGLMLGVIVGAVLFTIALVSANSVAHGIRERFGELAVLNALGFEIGTIQRLVVGEAALLVALGAIPGLLGAAALIAVARRSVPQLAGIQIGFDTVASAVAVASALTVLAAAEPVWRVGRMRIVDSLRGLAT